MGTDVDGTKKVAFGLSKIRGVGHNYAQAVVKATRINPDARMGSLSEGELSKLEDAIRDPAKHGIPSRLFNRRKDLDTGRDMHLVGPDLALRTKADLDLMKDIRIRKRCYPRSGELRGLSWELPKSSGPA